MATGSPSTLIFQCLSLHLVQLKMIAVGTVSCGVVNLCGSNSFPVLEPATFVALFMVVYKNDILFRLVCIVQTQLYY